MDDCWSFNLKPPSVSCCTIRRTDGSACSKRTRSWRFSPKKFTAELAVIVSTSLMIEHCGWGQLVQKLFYYGTDYSSCESGFSVLFCCFQLYENSVNSKRSNVEGNISEGYGNLLRACDWLNWPPFPNTFCCAVTISSMLLCTSVYAGGNPSGYNLCYFVLMFGFWRLWACWAKRC